eukprot:TRINITY_DN57619_c0_g1_i1.p1 TRINITY_DN57619_c0_g1~~TRINITY_DN57619_c0_g1_i1.p1  ORF type:complete len:275 (-),score=19.73 TRINITY_DN57619_c0_g1_i1:58-840(-)
MAYPGSAPVNVPSVPQYEPRPSTGPPPSSLTREVSQLAWRTAVSFAVTAANHIDQGATGIKRMCLFGGVSACVFSVWNLLFIYQLVLAPIHYLVYFYQLLFGVVSCLIEAPERFLEMSHSIKSAHEFVLANHKFLTTFGGRGLFYLFQGSLCLDLSMVSLSSLQACYMFLISILCILTQYDLLGVVCPCAMREGAKADGGESGDTVSGLPPQDHVAPRGQLAWSATTYDANTPWARAGTVPLTQGQPAPGPDTGPYIVTR